MIKVTKILTLMCERLSINLGILFAVYVMVCIIDHKMNCKCNFDLWEKWNWKQEESMHVVLFPWKRKGKLDWNYGLQSKL